MGKKKGGLYKLNQKSFDESKVYDSLSTILHTVSSLQAFINTTHGVSNMRKEKINDITCKSACMLNV